MDDNNYDMGYSDEIEQEFEEQLIDVDTGYDDEVDSGNEEGIVESDDLDSLTGRIDSSYKKIISSEEERDLQRELSIKLEELKEADKEVQRTRAFGDLSENEAFEHATRVSGELQDDISRIKYELSHSIVEDNENKNKEIGNGSRVKLIITDISGFMPTQNLEIIIVSEGHGSILESNVVKVPNTSEVYRNMEGSSSGSFNLTGTDGNIYKYDYELLRG